MTELAASFDLDALEVDGVGVERSVHLVGVHCAACGRHSFPVRPECPWCGGDATRVRLPKVGTVVSWTSIHLPLPFLGDPPIAVALVALGEGLHVQGVVRGGSDDAAPALEIGGPCRVMPMDITIPEGPLLAYCFEVVDA